MKRIIGVILFVMIVVIGIFLFTYWQGYSKYDTINLEELNIDITEKSLSNVKDLADILNKTGKDSSGIPNPRIKVFYQGEEVAYIDHEGNIYGVGNLTSNYGFFDYLGDSISKSIDWGWFKNITLSGDLQGNTGNFSSLKISDENVLKNIVEDTTPQLGGNLDAQTKNITSVDCILFENGGSICQS